jgi:hypothetical protein
MEQNLNLPKWQKKGVEKTTIWTISRFYYWSNLSMRRRQGIYCLFIYLMHPVPVILSSQTYTAVTRNQLSILQEDFSV